ncbi:hypothetical protein H4Q26_006317 [Puccinia striiformis f. sp. tritici PST-130]|nr:hypothetical protein H4Q26_006317 [Puccinia striiformis f. sp. tritici PST-130]
MVTNRRSQSLPSTKETLERLQLQSSLNAFDELPPCFEGDAIGSDPKLPAKPSPKLTKLGEYPKSLLAVHKRRDSTNRLALHLPFPRIAQYCQLHRAKTTVIPDGLNNGWPTTIDFGKVYKLVPSPFMKADLKVWKAVGCNKVQTFNALQLWSTELP